MTIYRRRSYYATCYFENNSLDWFHLDGDHTLVREDLVGWWPKLKSGGYATGHDYTMAGEHITVKQDVDAFVAERGLELQVAGLESDDIYERNYPTWVIQKAPI